MKVKSLLLLAILFLFYTCKKEEEKITQFSVGLTALDGGSVNASGGVFNEGETITVTATPKEGYEFVRWDFSDSSTSSENPIKILVSSDLVVSAVFQEEKKYSLAINIQGLGSVEKEIVNTNTLTNDDSFADGTVIKLTPIPKKDESFFTNWSGDVSSSDDSIQITINKSKSVTATFQYNLYKDIIGKWDSDITQKSIQTTSKNPSISVNYIIFNANNTFAVGFNTGVASGTYQIVSNKRLNFTSWQSNLPTVLSFLTSTQNFGSLSFISIINNTLSAALSLGTIPNINLKTFKKNANYNPTTQSFSQGSSTASSTSASCNIVLDQGDPDQRIDKGDKISNIIYKSTGCNSISLTATSSLPPGVNFATNQISSDVILGIISGRPTNQASGTYYYSFTNDNTVKGEITVGSQTPKSCILELTKISNSGPVSQTITSGSAIDKLRFEINNNCPNNINFNSTGLPPGLQAVKGTDYIYEISGTPSSIASGTYNYNVNAYNGTNTETLSGVITIIASSTSSTLTTGTATPTGGGGNTGTTTSTTGTSTLTDTTPPVIALNGQASITLSVGDTYTEAGATANDNVDGNITNNIVITGSVNTSSSGTYTITYTITDSSSNTASIERIISVFQPSSATYNINVTASNASNYTLSGSDRNGQISGNDPGITISLGDTLNFIVNAPGHPFYLKTVAGTGTGNTVSGASNNGTTNQTVSWTPTQAGTYYYICSLHGGMVGTITVN